MEFAPFKKQRAGEEKTGGKIIGYPMILNKSWFEFHQVYIKYIEAEDDSLPTGSRSPKISITRFHYN